MTSNARVKLLVRVYAYKLVGAIYGGAIYGAILFTQRIASQKAAQLLASGCEGQLGV